MKDRKTHFEQNPQGGGSAPEISQQQNKFSFVGVVAEKYDADENKKRNPLARIIRGYLCEFIRQSEQRLPPCNIMHDRNPPAAAYWASHPENFEDARAGGIFQTAASYRKFEKLYGRDVAGGKSAEFHAVGEIVRSTIDVFKEKYPQLDPLNPPAPSVYNDHAAAIKIAMLMRDWDRAIGR